MYWSGCLLGLDKPSNNVSRSDSLLGLERPNKNVYWSGSLLGLGRPSTNAYWSASLLGLVGAKVYALHPVSGELYIVHSVHVKAKHTFLE